MKRYVGIDPSSNTGFYIQDDKGNMILEEEVFYKYKNDPDRMIYIAEYLISKLNKYTDLICIEGFSYQSSGRAVSFQYGLGYLIRYLLIKGEFNYYEVSPNSLKEFATGKGKISKKDMIEPIKEKFNYYHASDNITDAFILSEIAKKLVFYNEIDYNEKEGIIIKKIVEGKMNTHELIETTIPSWMNPKSKKYFNRNI